MCNLTYLSWLLRHSTSTQELNRTPCYYLDLSSLILVTACTDFKDLAFHQLVFYVYFLS